MTIIDALQAATDALNNAVLQVLGIRQQIATQLDAKAQQTTTIINNFLNRPLQHSFFVDPANGLDTNDGGTVLTAYKTLDAALDAQPNDGSTIFYLLGDCVVGKYRGINAQTGFYGATVGIGAQQNIISGHRRTLTFAGEASNSPIANIGRVSAGFNANIPIMSFENIDVMMQSPPAGLGIDYCLQVAGCSVDMTNCTLDAQDANSSAAFMASTGGSQSHLWFSGSLGPNAPGHIFKGYAAGSNGNQNYIFETNLPSV